MIKLSVVISAHNEEKKLKECLESVNWADEIIVVDNGSTDKTAEIAKRITKHVYYQKNDPDNIDLQKNLGIEKARGEWILVLDADERVTPELEQEIKRVIVNDQRTINGYWIPRKNIIFGKWIEHSGWYPDYTLRLFRKGKGKYVSKHYHEPLQVDGQTEKLKEHLLHYNYESISQLFHRNLEQYAPNEAEAILKKGYVFNRMDAIRFPFNEFLSRYFAREGYKDGFHGLMLAMLMAVSHFAIFCYIWEKEKFVEEQNIASLQEGLRDELKKTKKEIKYWIYSAKIAEEKNLLGKVGLKVKRKLNI